MFQLLYDISVQCIAIAVFHIADMAPAALLHGAKVGIDHLPFVFRRWDILGRMYSPQLPQISKPESSATLLRGLR